VSSIWPNDHKVSINIALHQTVYFLDQQINPLGLMQSANKQDNKLAIQPILLTEQPSLWQVIKLADIQSGMDDSHLVGMSPKPVELVHPYLGLGNQGSGISQAAVPPCSVVQAMEHLLAGSGLHCGPVGIDDEWDSVSLGFRA